MADVRSTRTPRPPLGPGSVFDAPQAPPPTGPVGGRLGQFATAWSRITTDSWALQTIRVGYRLEFTEPPEHLGIHRETPIPLERELAASLKSELSKLLTKRAVLEAKHLPEDFFMSTFFLAPKKGGKWRPILNLKPLNRYIRPKRFRMETLHSIIPMLSQGWWATSVDLTDAYMHVPVHAEHRKFLAFAIEGRKYMFQALPFGLSTAPRVFTRLARIFGAHIRKLGVRIYMYLDDWLIVAPDPQTAARDTARVVREAEAFGWLINREKSDLVPSQTPQFLGAILDFRQGQARPTPDRIQTTLESARLLRQRPVATAREWLVFLGYLASLVDLVPWCRFHMRDLQFHLLRFFNPASSDLATRVPWEDGILSALLWWQDSTHLSVGMPFFTPEPSVTLITDASLSGWGGHLGPHKAAGRWTGQWLQCHINLLELEAVRRSALQFLDHLHGRSVLLRTDNTTVVSYINRQGGTHSPSLWRLTKDLLTWAMHHGISIHAVHLPGKENTIADLLSRLSDSPTEWSLLETVTHLIWVQYGRPEVDLFAAPDNHKLRTFCALTPHPRAWRVDAFTCDWQNLVAYAFPPPALIARVLRKVQADGCTSLLLVAPVWPSQPWFPVLLQLLVDHPRTLPDRRDLLTIPGSGRHHHCPSLLHLTVWPLSANPYLQRDFRKKLPKWPPPSGGGPQWLCIRDDSESSPYGARGDKSLLLRPL